MSKTHWVELVEGKPSRIFKNKHAATASPAWAEGRVREMDKCEAIRSIRSQVFVNAGGHCERCAKPLTWDSLHMNERVHRGRGGEVSVTNGEALCYDCHEGLLGEHRDRTLRPAKLTRNDEST